jgi:DNA-binding MarR family transcriptional regulator
LAGAVSGGEVNSMDVAIKSLGLGKSRKVKHRKLTQEQWAVLEREADLIAQLSDQSELARRLGVTRGYVCQVLSRLVRERRGVVPRLAHKFSLDESIDRLVERLRKAGHQ